jgi:hypothetical protein
MSHALPGDSRRAAISGTGLQEPRGSVTLGRGPEARPGLDDFGDQRA